MAKRLALRCNGPLHNGIPLLMVRRHQKGVFMNKAITDGVVLMPLPFSAGLGVVER